MSARRPAPVRPAAIVMGLGPGGLGVVRSLACLGVEVHGVYSADGLEVGRHSRFLRGRWPVRDSGSDVKVVAVLRAIRRRVSPGHRMVLIPANDRYALLTSRRRRELEEDFILRVPPESIGTTFLDKRATTRMCRDRGIPIPRSCVPDSLEDVQDVAETFRYPAIIKPALQDDPAFPGKNAIVDSPGELLAFYLERQSLVTRSMFQEMVRSGDGHILGVNTYSGLDGRVLACTSHRRLRQWLPDRGATCFGVTETLTALQASTVQLLQGLGYVGFAGVEYAEDLTTGAHLFLELNARVVLPNQLFADSGVDLTTVGYLEMSGQPTPLDLVQRDDVYWMDLHRDLPSSFLAWRRGRLGVREWLGDLRRVSSHATFDARDPKPFAATLAVLASVAAGRVSGRQLDSLRSRGARPQSR